MVKINTAKTITYLLVIPTSPVATPPPPPPPPSIIPPEDNENNRKKRGRRSCAITCKCLVGLLGGLALAALLAVAIAVPIVVNLSSEESKTASTEASSITSTTSTSTSTSTTTTTDIPCSPTCTSQQTCVKGVCVGIGYLSCTLTWSRNGDGDIVVRTPNNNIINYNNMGPNASTDEGQLDVDDKVGTGPENVFWSNSSTVPPTGVYYVCFSQFSFSPSASSLEPITASITIVRSTNTIITVTKNFTSVVKNETTCTSTSLNLLTSFTYP